MQISLTQLILKNIFLNKLFVLIYVVEMQGYFFLKKLTTGSTWSD